LTYLFKGLSQNIVALTADEMEQVYEERMEKIKALGLSGIMMSTNEVEIEEVLDTEAQDKGEIMGSVIEDLEDF
jgi:2-iminoacetate synthase ThiH